MRSPLGKTLRNQLENAVEKARDIAELAAYEELQRLAVGEKAAADYLTQGQRGLRNRLRAHARMLGNTRKTDGEQEVTNLVAEIAYEHWHRMLFSRFLAENDLLMYDDGITALAISDCFDLAEEETGDSSNGWRYAANYAAKMLSQIFRNESPVFEVEFAPNHQKKLEKLLEELNESIFRSQDALGWVYQFWQSKRKEEVNASEVKIGAQELSPVTQLFTEPYMVSFLLDNALGAWWANQQLTGQDYATALSEAELREKAAIDGLPLEYLRFIKTYTSEQQVLLDSEDAPKEKPEPRGPWEPAAGKFEHWPNELSELKTLDPCCGSGHFLVAVFLMLVPIRMQREGLSESEAIDAVLSQNIYGLELDQRCVEIAVFALALEAWRYPNGGGYRQLPELHLACSGLSVKAAKEEWKELGLGKKNLTIALDWMHNEFSDAPVLGSLINPAKSSAANIVSWGELSTTLNEALDQESVIDNEGKESPQSIEATVVAQGMTKAATMLAGKYQWVATNVPYLARGKQDDTLKDFIEKNHPAGKSDLATAFLDRCIDFCVEGGSVSVVSPENWLFLNSYKNFREQILTNETLNTVAMLGGGAFDTISGQVVKAILLTLTHDSAKANTQGLFSIDFASHSIRGIDVSQVHPAASKAEQLVTAGMKSVAQAEQSKNPDGIFSLEVLAGDLVNQYSTPHTGLQTGDNDQFSLLFWEVPYVNTPWTLFQRTTERTIHFSGARQILRWHPGGILLKKHPSSAIRGLGCRGSRGILVHRMGSLPCTFFLGEIFDQNGAVITLKSKKYLPATWCYLSSAQYNEDVRKIDSKLGVTPATLAKVPFDLNHWQNVADDSYPNGLPAPYSNDPTQWIFHGHPCGSAIWDEEKKWTAKGELRADDTVLQVVVFRLLGYQWPAEVDPEMELASEQQEWVEESITLQSFVDDDGIVCLPAVRGEKSADDRLEELLQAAYGEVWSTTIRNKLLEAADCKNKSLAFWLRERFFEQHCKLFQHRPFIWHIWDGLKDGFSALVNYHQLDKKNLERLIYTYLDDWIRTQSHQQADGIDGAAERMVAANNLKERLELILEGEAPYDIFVRWKPLEEQPIGWNPDLNDGVRLNIRPFLTAGVLRHSKKPRINIHWNKDRGRDIESTPWYKLGLEYDGKEGDRINDHHLSLLEKLDALNL